MLQKRLVLGPRCQAATARRRDTCATAVSLGVDEAWIGVLVLAPAVLDIYRYYHPHARWATWLSRGFKIGSVLLVLK